MDDIDAMVDNLWLDEGDAEEEDMIEDWGTIADESRNQDSEKSKIGVENEVNVQEAIEKTEVQRKALEEQNAKKVNQERKARFSQKKRRIRYSPPGLKIFHPSFFHVFRRSSLDIEKDFEYDKRATLKEKVGLSDEKICKIFTTPWEFIMFLCPSMTSPMIKDEKDFERIADFLFFQHASTRSYETAAITKKALFSLLKNYSYTWKLKLKHLVPTLLNLGMEASTILEQENYDDFLINSKPREAGHKFAVYDHMPIWFRKKYDQRAPTENENLVETDPDEDIIKGAEELKLSYVGSEDEEDEYRKDSDELPEDYHWEPVKYVVVRRTIETICDLICTFPKSTTFVHTKGENYNECLVAFYLFGTIASDWHLIVDSEIWTNVSSAMRVMLDGFGGELWKTASKDDTSKKEKTLAKDAVSLDIVDALMMIGRTTNAANLRPWNIDDCHQALVDGDGDHHDNMFRRLQLLPQTRRGNIIRKMMAHQSLQIILKTNNDKSVTSIPHADSSDAARLLTEYKAGLNLFEKNDEYYVVLSIVRMLDVMVGNEPFIDFKEQKHKDIAAIEKHLEDYKNQKLNNAMMRESDTWKLKEAISQIKQKWHLLKRTCEEGRKELYVRRER